MKNDCLRSKNVSTTCAVCGRRPDGAMHLVGEPAEFYCEQHCPSCSMARVPREREVWKLTCSCGHEFETPAGPGRDTVRCPSCAAVCRIEWRRAAASDGVGWVGSLEV